MAGFCGLIGDADSDSLIDEARLDRLSTGLEAIGRRASTDHHGRWRSAIHQDQRDPDKILTAEDRPLRLISALRFIRDHETTYRGEAAATVLLRGWRANGIGFLERVDGEFAGAIWDSAADRLLLFRSPLSPFPLAYGLIDDRIVFSSMAFSVAGLRPEGRRISIAALSRRLTGSSFAHQQSVFTEVETVEPGTLVSVVDGKIDIIRYWHPHRHQVSKRGDADAAQVLRHALDRAVEDAIGETHRPVAAHLSAGRDSSAVAATASKLGHDVTAYTAAPGHGYPAEVGRFLIDESVAAARTAGQLSIEHQVVRPSATKLCLEMDRLHRVHAVPIGTPINLPWWEAILSRAASNGAKVLLAADAGNLTISLGGPRFLPDVLARSGPLSWWREIRRASAAPGSSWPNLIKFSFGPHLPRWAYRLGHRLTGRSADRVSNPFLSGLLAEQVKRELAEEDPRPVADNRRSCQSALLHYDPADVTANSIHGVSVRDPTADRTVVEAALTLSDEQLVSAYHRRTIYDLAFADLLPNQGIRFAKRGIQSADWNGVILPDDLAAGLERYGSNPLVHDLLDVKRMREAIAAWPKGVLFDGPVKQRFANHLLEALAVASFLWVHDIRSCEAG